MCDFHIIYHEIMKYRAQMYKRNSIWSQRLIYSVGLNWADLKQKSVHHIYKGLGFPADQFLNTANLSKAHSPQWNMPNSPHSSIVPFRVYDGMLAIIGIPYFMLGWGTSGTCNVIRIQMDTNVIKINLSRSSFLFSHPHSIPLPFPAITPSEILDWFWGGGEDRTGRGGSAQLGWARSRWNFISGWYVKFDVVIESCIQLHFSCAVNDPLYKYTVSYHRLSVR